MNDDYIVNKYNIEENEVILMKVFAQDDGINFEVKSGPEHSKVSYFDLLDYVEQNDMSKDEHFNHVKEQIDINNFFHFVAYQIYYANTDSFSNNMRVWRKNTEYVKDAPVGHDGRWRYMLFDLDWGMGFWIHNALNYTEGIVTYNMVSHVLKDERRMSLFRNLMEHDDAREEFIYIMSSLLNDQFAVNTVKTKIDELALNIKDEIPSTIERWNNIESVDKWEENIQALHDFAERRPNIVKQHILTVFNLTEEDLNRITEKYSTLNK